MEGSCRQSWRMKGSGPDAGEVGMSLAARDALAEITSPGKVKVAVPNSFKHWVPHWVMRKPLSGKTH